MTEAKRVNWLLALLLAGLANVLIFSWIPVLSESDHPVQSAATSEPVFLSQYRPPEPERKPPQEPPRQQEPPAPPRLNLPGNPAKPQLPRMALQMPPLNYEINPSLTVGLALPPLPPSPAGPQEFELGQVDQPPQPIRQIEPLYPYAARRRGVSGQVTVRFLVDAEGNVSHLTVLEAEPKGVFEQSVKDSVSQWRFKPGILKGKPVATWVVLPIRFDLKG